MTALRWLRQFTGPIIVLGILMGLTLFDGNPARRHGFQTGYLIGFILVCGMILRYGPLLEHPSGLMRILRRYRARTAIYQAAWDCLQCGVPDLAKMVWDMADAMTDDMADDPEQFAARMRWIANAKAGSTDAVRA